MNTILTAIILFAGAAGQVVPWKTDVEEARKAALEAEKPCLIIVGLDACACDT